jgi:putative transposase
VDWAMQETGHSQRHDCGLVGLDPKSYRYASRRSEIWPFERG